MAGNNEAELVRLMNNAIKGIGELRVSNDDLKSGQVRIESQLEKLENQLKIVENDVKSVQTEV